MASLVMVSAAWAADAPSVVVGRVYHVEGDLLRYVPEENDWIAAVRDAPFGAEDTLFSGDRGLAELIVPNGTWVRIGQETQVQFITLENNLSEMDVASGVARFYNKGDGTLIKVTSPFGYVLADPRTIFDFYVGENSAEVIAVRGTVTFVHAAMESRFDVTAGSPSILADRQQVSPGEGTTDQEWAQWNKAREDHWDAKTGAGGRSAEYLPPSLRDEAYALEENGTWERIPYEGSERLFWRPTTVVTGWSPYTVGRWTDWYGDQTWIPAEPFGYITHHYGNWILVGNIWYWAPPVASVHVGFPLLDIGFSWYPGRVSWIYTGTYVGWVPLAPAETYYCRRHWGGPHTVVITSGNVTRIHINVRHYAYINRAIVVNRDQLYRVNNYRNVRVTNISRTTIINNYRAAPVVNDTVIRNYRSNRERFNFTNIQVKEKPHSSVITRIERNRSIIRQVDRERAPVTQEGVRGIREGRVAPEARIEPPRVTSRLVPAGEVNRPRSEMRLQQREIKRRGQGGPETAPGAVVRPESPAAPSGRPETPVRTRERVVPKTPSRVVPPRTPQVDRSGSAGTPAQRQERVAPQTPSRVTPPRTPQVDRSGPSGTPAQRQERVAPQPPSQVAPPRTPQVDRSGPSGAPAQRQERVAPQPPSQVAPPRTPQVDRSGPSGTPAQRQERVAPAGPDQTEKSVPAERPDRRGPKRPGQQESP